MKTANISFGKVTAVSGRPSKVDKLNNRLEQRVRNGRLIKRDVTHIYKNAPSGYEIADAAAMGHKVEIYVTGEDVKKIKNRESGWNTLESVLSQITSYFSLSGTSIDQAVEKIMRG